MNFVLIDHTVIKGGRRVAQSIKLTFPKCKHSNEPIFPIYRPSDLRTVRRLTRFPDTSEFKPGGY